MRRLIEAVAGPPTWRNLSSWLAVIVLALAGKWLLLDIFRVPSNSMEPALHGGGFLSGDRVLVNKLAYGPRFPFSVRRIWHRAAPRRWDVVVFRALPNSGGAPYLVKRVAGLPGERVHIENGTLYINGHPETPPPEIAPMLAYTVALSVTDAKTHRTLLEFAKKNEAMTMLNPANPTVQALYREMARLHPAARDLDLDALDDTEAARLCEDAERGALNLVRHMLAKELLFGVAQEPQWSVIPEGCYFLLGDNGPDSFDSRAWGWVPEGHILGRVFAVAWPPARMRDISGFSRTWQGKALLAGAFAALFAAEAMRRATARARKCKARRAEERGALSEG